MMADALEEVKFPDLKGVFRQVDWYSNGDAKILLVPANGAIAVLLRAGLIDSFPNFHEMKAHIMMWYAQKEGGNENKKN